MKNDVKYNINNILITIQSHIIIFKIQYLINNNNNKYCNKKYII